MRINDRIRVPRVRVVGVDGSQIGVLETKDALAMALQQDLDLVEVAPQADPPVVRIMDFGKYKYEQDQAKKEARKKQSQVVVKEMKMRPKIDRHDYETKKGHVVRFLRQGAKVKVTIMFRGREMVHPELGEKLLLRLADDVEEIAKIDVPPKLDGRNMTMVLNPLKEAIVHREPVEQHVRQRRQQPQTSEVEHEEPVAEEPVAEEPKPTRPAKITRAASDLGEEKDDAEDEDS
jgi:translation initiation factor IF-3